MEEQYSFSNKTSVYPCAVKVGEKSSWKCGWSEGYGLDQRQTREKGEK